MSPAGRGCAQRSGDPDTVVRPRVFPGWAGGGQRAPPGGRCPCGGPGSQRPCAWSVRPAITPAREPEHWAFRSTTVRPGGASRPPATRRTDTVLIVDWDVHHGNGTQDIFYEDPEVMFFSIHRYGMHFFPAPAVGRNGHGSGLGYTSTPRFRGTSTGPRFAISSRGDWSRRRIKFVPNWCWSMPVSTPTCAIRSASCAWRRRISPADASGAGRCPHACGRPHGLLPGGRV